MTGNRTGTPGRVIPVLILLAMGCAWGLQFTMLKLAVDSGYGETNVVLLALALIAMVYGLMMFIRRSFFRLNRERLVFFTVTAVIGYLLPMGATVVVAPHLHAGVIVLIASLAPIFTFAVAILLKTEPVSLIRIGAMLLGLISALLVLVPQTALPGGGAIIWIVLALAIPFCYGVESIYVSARWPAGLTVLQVGFGEAMAALVLLMPLLMFLPGEVSIPLSGSMAEVAVAIFVLCGVFEVFMYFHLVKTTGGVLVSFATFISLFAGIGWGILVFDEVHSPSTWVAVCVLVGSLALVSIESYRRNSQAAPSNMP